MIHCTPLQQPPSWRSNPCLTTSAAASAWLATPSVSEFLPFLYRSLRRRQPFVSPTAAISKTHLKNQSPEKPWERSVSGTASMLLRPPQGSSADKPMQDFAVQEAVLSMGVGISPHRDMPWLASPSGVRRTGGAHRVHLARCVNVKSTDALR